MRQWRARRFGAISCYDKIRRIESVSFAAELVMAYFAFEFAVNSQKIYLIHHWWLRSMVSLPYRKQYGSAPADDCQSQNIVAY
jgi:hypothetical protein